MIQWLAIPVAARIAWALAHFLWQGVLLGLIAWGVLALMRRQSTQLRYIVACGFLLSCLAAPIVTFLRLTPTSAVTLSTLSTAPSQTPVMLPTASSLTLHRPKTQRVPWVFSLRSQLISLMPWILGFWIVGVGFFSLRSVGEWIRLQRFKSEGSEVMDGYWRDQLAEMALCIGIGRTMRVLECGRIVTPLAKGILRPVVVVPLGFFVNHNPLAIEAILAHELAHIQRLDVLASGVQCAIETLLFFHPAVWWISRRIRLEREYCCDDAAIQACGNPVLFAEILSRLPTLRGLLVNPAVGDRGQVNYSVDSSGW